MRSITSLDVYMIYHHHPSPHDRMINLIQWSIVPLLDSSLGASSASDPTNTLGQSHPLIHSWYHHPPSLQDPIKQHWRRHTIEYSIFLNAICYFSMSKLLNRNFGNFLWNFGSGFSEQKFEIPNAMMKVGKCTISQDTKLDTTTQYLAISTFLHTTNGLVAAIPCSFDLMEKSMKYFCLQMDTKLSHIENYTTYVGYSNIFMADRLQIKFRWIRIIICFLVHRSSHGRKLSQ